ncbi:MAG: RNA polymerase sigma factor [Oscillospiraceae bacterium]|nr:RNA polymerase sigma factor [Oscillospiraceae bacterium]
MERTELIRLVTGAQNGDSAAAEALFTAHYSDVYYFALKTVKDADLACDITQETFLEVIRTLGNLREPAAFVTWLKQITYHCCTRHFRKDREILVDEDEDGNTLFDTLADEREGSIPAEVCEQAEFRQTILGIIDTLSAEQRAAVLLYYFDELPVGEIAKIQNVSEGTVKSRLNYARKAIKKSVEDYEKKHGIKLHSVALLPLLCYLFREDAMAAAPAAEVAAEVSAAAVATKTAAVKTAAAAKAGTMSVAAKVAAVIAAVGITAGALLGAFGFFSPKDGTHRMRDRNGDALCDRCGIGACFYLHEDAPPHTADTATCHCAVCGDVVHAAALEDPRADYCPDCDMPLCPESTGSAHLDAGDDMICDVCGLDLTTLG